MTEAESEAGEPTAAALADLDRLRKALYAQNAPPGAAEAYAAAVARAVPAPPEGSAPDDASVVERRLDEPAPPAHREESSRRSGPRRRLGTVLVAAAALVAALGAAVLLAPRPVAEPVVAPLRTGPALWSGSGTDAAASPELDGHGSAVFVRLRCRGEGRILLALDGRVRSVSCTAARTVRDDQYFDGAHDRFQLSLSLVGHPFWSASVHRVLTEPGQAAAGAGGQAR